MPVATTPIDNNPTTPTDPGTGGGTGTNPTGGTGTNPNTGTGGGNSGGGAPNGGYVDDTLGNGLEIRAYHALGANFGKRLELPARLIGPASWTIEPLGGYADFSLSVFEDAETGQFPPVEIGARFEIFKFGVRLFRGYATDLSITEDEPATLGVSGYGRIFELDKMLMRGDYQYPAAVDVSQIFLDIAFDIQARYPDIVVQSEIIGIKANNLDAHRKTAREALASLYEFVSAVAVIGFDAEPITGRDRLYLRKKSAVVDHVIAIPGARTGKRESAQNLSDVVNVVSIEGDESEHPQLLPNSSFETMRKAGDGGNLLKNPSFENGDVDEWTLSGGADTFEVGAHSGNTAIGLDNLGEKLSQLQQTPDYDLVAGRDYTLSFWAKPMPQMPVNNPTTIEARFYWRFDDGSFSLATNALPVISIVQQWKEYDLSARCPVNATGFKVEFEHMAGSSADGKGALVDDVSFYDASSLVPEAWDLRVHGSAQVNSVNWRARNAYHGRNCLFLYVSSSDEDNEDIHVRCTPDHKFPVAAGQNLRFSLREKTTGNLVAPKQLLDIRFFDADDDQIGNTTRVTINPSTPYADWTYIETLVVAPQNAVTAEAWVTIRGSGIFYMDALSVRVADDNETIFLDSGNLFASFRADELVTLAEDAEVNQSISRYGLREKIVKIGGIKNIADARTAAKNFLLDNASDVPAPVVEVLDYAQYLWVGHAVRLAGKSAARYADRVLPVMRINGAIDGAGLLTHSLELKKTQPTEQEMYAALAKKAAK